MVEHPEVSALINAGGSHRIREKLAANLDVVSPRLRAIDQGQNVLLRHAAFHKDSRNLSLNQQINQLIDPLQPGFGFCRQPLNAKYFQIVSTAKVVERIVRRHEHST